MHTYSYKEKSLKLQLNIQNFAIILYMETFKKIPKLFLNRTVAIPLYIIEALDLCHTIIEALSLLSYIKK